MDYLNICRVKDIQTNIYSSFTAAALVAYQKAKKPELFIDDFMTFLTADFLKRIRKSLSHS